MSRGDGGVVIVVTVYITVWTGTGLAPLAFGLFAGAFLVVWIAGLVGASALASAILFARHWRAAVANRNWLWVAELVAVPVAAMWIGWAMHDRFRDFWVDRVAAANADAASTFLFGAMMFAFFLVCFPISIWGMGVGVDAGLAGSALRVLVTGLTPLVIAVGSWTALVDNTVDPVPVRPPEPVALQTACESAVRDAADRALAEPNAKDPTGSAWLQVGHITPSKPNDWNWRTGTVRVPVTVAVQWWRSDQIGPVAENPFPWTCSARWSPDSKAWTVAQATSTGIPVPSR